MSLFELGGMEPDAHASGAEGPPDPWCDARQMMERVRQGSVEGMEDLYDLVRCTAEWHFGGQFGARDCEARVHDLYLVVLEAVREGALRDFGQLSGFVRTVARYQSLMAFQRNSPARSRAGRFEDRNGEPLAAPSRIDRTKLPGIEFRREKRPQSCINKRRIVPTPGSCIP